MIGIMTVTDTFDPASITRPKEVWGHFHWKDSQIANQGIIEWLPTLLKFAMKQRLCPSNPGLRVDNM